MVGVIDVFKVIFVPALIAFFLYLLLAHAILPLIRNHRNRYSQYLPLDTLDERTTSLRQRISGVVTRFFLPPSIRWRHGMVVDGRRGSGSGDELAFGEEEGESMVGFDVERRDRSVRGGHVSAREEIDSERRLSRDLEEVFKDDSEDEGGDDRRR